MSSFPKSINDLSLEWLSEKLNKSITNFTFKRIGYTTGYLSEVYRVSFNENDSVVIKFANDSGLASSSHLYKVEVNFYRYCKNNNINGGLHSPICYYVDYNEDSHYFILVLEDLKPPYHVGNQNKGITIQEMKDSLEQIAKFHAFWWNKHTNDNDFSKIPGKSLFNLWVSFINAFWESKGKQCFEKEKLLDNKIEKCINFLITYGKCISISKKTLVHGDFRPDNTMIWRSNKECTRKIVSLDFQLIHWGNPMEDVSYILSNGITKDLRKKHEEEFLKHYFNHLKGNGVNDYSYDSLLSDYKENLIYCILMPVLSVLHENENSEQSAYQKNAQEMSKVWRERAVQAFLDNNCIELIQELSDKYSKTIKDDKYPNIDSDLATFVEYYDSKNVNWQTHSLEKYRDEVRHTISHISKNLPISEIDIESYNNIPEKDNIPELRIISPSNPSGKVIVYLTNAWIAGHDLSELIWRFLCKESKSHIICIKYKNCPENTFKDMLNDCYNGLINIIDNYEGLNIPKISSVTLIGDRQGSHLACSLISLLLKKDKLHYISKLILTFPWLDKSCNSESYKCLGNTYGSLIGTDLCKWHWNKYLPESNTNEELINPLKYSNDILSKFPPTLITIADQDVTKSEAELFYKKLKENNIDVECITYPKVIHTFYTPHLSKGKQVLEFISSKI